MFIGADVLKDRVVYHTGTVSCSLLALKSRPGTKDTR